MRLADAASGVEAELKYGVLPQPDVITRAARITNKSKPAVTPRKAAGKSLDWQYGDYDWITFHGRHVMERNLQRAPLQHGIQSVGSVRGTSSHHYNPFSILCERGTNETEGSCTPEVMMAYSSEGFGHLSWCFHKTKRFVKISAGVSGNTRRGLS